MDQVTALPVLEHRAAFLLRLLHRIDAGGTCIVVSSSWRLQLQRSVIVRHLDRYGLQEEMFHDDWLTPCLAGCCRGEEIEQWLRQHPEITKFVIVDDMTPVHFLKNQRKHHVRPNTDVGFDYCDFEKACRVLHETEVSADALARALNARHKGKTLPHSSFFESRWCEGVVEWDDENGRPVAVSLVPEKGPPGGWLTRFWRQ